MASLVSCDDRKPVGHLPKTGRCPLSLQLHTSEGMVSPCCASQKASTEQVIVNTCVAVNGLMRRSSSGWAALNKCRHRLDIATPLPDSLHPPGHPSGRVLCEDLARPLRIIEWHIAAGYHVDRLVGRT